MKSGLIPITIDYCLHPYGTGNKCYYVDNNGDSSEIDSTILAKLIKLAKKQKLVENTGFALTKTGMALRNILQ